MRSVLTRADSASVLALHQRVLAAQAAATATAYDATASRDQRHEAQRVVTAATEAFVVLLADLTWPDPYVAPTTPQRRMR